MLLKKMASGPPSSLGIYRAIIDCDAWFKEFTSEQVARAIAKHDDLKDHIDYVAFIDKQDKKWMIDVKNSSRRIDYDPSITGSNDEKVFFFYDQRNTVGTDMKLRQVQRPPPPSPLMSLR